MNICISSKIIESAKRYMIIFIELLKLISPDIVKKKKIKKWFIDKITKSGDISGCLFIFLYNIYPMILPGYKYKNIIKKFKVWNNFFNM